MVLLVRIRSLMPQDARDRLKLFLHRALEFGNAIIPSEGSVKHVGISALLSDTKQAGLSVLALSNVRSDQESEVARPPHLRLAQVLHGPSVALDQLS